MPMARCATPLPNEVHAFQQDPRHLATVQQHVIGPFQTENAAGKPRHTPQRHRAAPKRRQQSCAAPLRLRRLRGVQDQRAVEIAASGLTQARARRPRPAVCSQPPKTTLAPSETRPAAIRAHWCCRSRAAHAAGKCSLIATSLQCGKNIPRQPGGVKPPGVPQEPPQPICASAAFTAAGSMPNRFTMPKQHDRSHTPPAPTTARATMRLCARLPLGRRST